MMVHRYIFQCVLEIWTKSFWLFHDSEKGLLDSRFDLRFNNHDPRAHCVPHLKITKFIGHIKCSVPYVSWVSVLHRMQVISCRLVAEQASLPAFSWALWGTTQLITSMFFWCLVALAGQYKWYHFGFWNALPAIFTGRILCIAYLRWFNNLQMGIFSIFSSVILSKVPKKRFHDSSFTMCLS